MPLGTSWALLQGFGKPFESVFGFLGCLMGLNQYSKCLVQNILTRPSECTLQLPPEKFDYVHMFKCFQLFIKFQAIFLSKNLPETSPKTSQIPPPPNLPKTSPEPPQHLPKTALKLPKKCRKTFQQLVKQSKFLKGSCAMHHRCPFCSLESRTFTRDTL